MGETLQPGTEELGMESEKTEETDFINEFKDKYDVAPKDMEKLLRQIADNNTPDHWTQSRQTEN